MLGLDPALRALRKLASARLQDRHAEPVARQGIALSDFRVRGLLGAGGGGFFAFFVPKKAQETFLSLMQNYICVSASVAYKGIEKIHHDNI